MTPQVNRECFTPGQFAPGNASNTRLCKVLLAEPKPTRHGFIARATKWNMAQAFKQRKRSGSFTPMPEGRDTLAFLGRK
jgi:hypothetical protein